MQIIAIKANSRKTRGIYVIHNKITNEYYVGKTTTSFFSRWQDHKSTLKHGYHYNSGLQIAWDKYGAANFDFLIVELLAKDAPDFAQKEQLWIDKLSSNFSVFNIQNCVKNVYKEPKRLDRIMSYEELRIYRRMRRRRDIKPETRLKMFGK